jgi:hypothetical protein
VDTDELFLRTVDDLRERAKSLDEYKVLNSGGLLRKLLTDRDSYRLLDQVNASRQLDIRFRINGESRYEREVMQDKPWYWSLENAIDADDPRVPPGMRAPIDATREQLLARRVMRVNGHDIVISALIHQLADIEGSVHKGNPNNARERMLQEVAKRIYVNGLPAGVSQVRSINTVVARGLEPLRAAIVAATPGSSRS